MYRLISWSFGIVCLYQAIKYHHLGWLVGAIVIAALIFILDPFLNFLAYGDDEVSPPG